MGTHMPGFQYFSIGILHHFVLAKLTTSSKRVKSFKALRPYIILEASLSKSFSLPGSACEWPISLTTTISVRGDIGSCDSQTSTVGAAGVIHG